MVLYCTVHSTEHVAISGNLTDKCEVRGGREINKMQLRYWKSLVSGQLAVAYLHSHLL